MDFTFVSGADSCEVDPCVDLLIVWHCLVLEKYSVVTSVIVTGRFSQAVVGC